ncbi:AraC family transcriptional regulator [Paludibaculum fermentans]|uniref:AraC family transcriptional regulator n=1 Tax=Paludibaculum fermentans TaxID=1473598 RepID=A0A7S7NXW3_PALFE|nr:AraC family transcriptional regulator [Paludibaculum fermentans]QOY91805.1 AraC family transcriptional regulator [Paludibaculum fermentans]
MDAFSDILSGVKLNGAFYFNAEFSAPWGVNTPASQHLTAMLSPGSPHLVIYHLVLEGGAFAHMDGSTLPLVPGDVVVFPHGHPHVLTSEPESFETRETAEVQRKVQARDLTRLQAGGGGSRTRLVCGFMGCDPQLSRPILSSLPPILKVNVRTGASGQWLENSILQLVEEASSGRVGSEAMLAKLSEALFVDILRRYIASLPQEQTGWLSGARDPVVGRSLGLMHRRAHHPWTLADLAREVGISRSALVERFTRYLSEPPMTYLTRWRLQLAARSLERTPKGVAEIASEVGYESEAAFNRAFKREFGLPPARYRRERRGAAAEQPAT